jgi:amino acid adenylation domain-containing protein
MQLGTGKRTILDLVRMTCEAEPAGNAASFPAQPAVGIAEEVRYPRARLERDAKALAARLARTATGPVVLVLPPGPEYLKAFLGCVYAGLPAAPVYPPNPADARRDIPRLRAVLARLPEATVLTEPRLLEPLRALLAEQLPDVRIGQLLDTATPAGAEDEWREPAVDPDDPVVVQFTSGSTSTPRGVLISHRNLLANIAALGDRFGLDRTSTGVLWLPPYHDMGLVGGLLTPLVIGFPIHLLSPLSFLADPASWLRLVSETGASHTGAPNFGYALAARRTSDEDLATLDLSGLRVAFCGAEPVSADTLRAFASRFAPAGFRDDMFLPCYGLAENTLIVTGGRPGDGLRVHRLDPAALAAGRAEPAGPAAPATELVANGSPVLGTEMVIVDRNAGRPVRTGEVGEVLVASDCVSSGYLGDPEATARTFGATVAGSTRRWLRTGDLGFLSDAGELVPVGRIKDVIVVRGRNIYPQDIERSVQDAHPGIRRGCVAAAGVPDPENGEAVLVVAELRPELVDDPAVARQVAAAVRAAVTGDHSVPVQAVSLVRPATLPKTSSGKVRRSAAREAHLDGSLPSVLCDTGGPTGAAPTGTGDPHDPLVPLAATLIERVGGRDGTTHGLESLAAAQLVGEVAQTFRVAVPMPEVLAGLDATGLADLIRAAPAMAPVVPTAPVPLAGPAAPASARQEALCLLHEVDPGAPGLVLGIAFRLPEDLSPDTVGSRIAALVSRHEALRTRLVRDGEHWLRVVDPDRQPAADAPWGRYCVPVRLQPAGGLTARQLAGELADRCRQVPDLSEGPLFRAELLRADGHPAHLVVTVHHAVADLWSIGVLAAELAELVGAADRTHVAVPPPPVPPPPVPPVPSSPPDPRQQARAWRFWRDVLGDGVPPLQLAPAARAASPAFDGLTRASVHAPLVLDRRCTAGLAALAKQCGVTRYTVLLAAQALALARLTGEGRVPIAVPLHGRDSATFQAVDYLVSTVTIPVDTASTTGTVGDLVAQVAGKLRGSLAHRTVGYPELVALSAASDGPDVPVPAVALLLQQDTPGAPRGLTAGLLGAGSVRIGEAELPVAVPPPSVGPFGLATLLAEHGDRLVGRVELDPGRHQPWLAGQFATTFLAVADSLAQGAERPLAEVSAVGAAEAELIRGWSVSREPAATGGILPDLVLAAAQRHPERVAVAAADGSLTFAELVDRSTAVAAGLVAAGAGRGDPVGVMLPRGRDLPAALLGVMRAGAAYLPLDPAWPAARLAAVVADAGCRRVLVDALVDAEPVRRQLLPVRTLVLAELLAAGGRSAAPAPRRAGPDDPAYLLFTSGSTGRPKGVVIPHRAAVNLVRWAGGAFSPAELARTLAVTPTTFDLSVFELFVPLAHGGEVRLLDSVLDLLRSPAHAADATLLNTVPSAVAALLERDALPAGLRVVNMAGEALTAELVRAVHGRIPGVRVVNLYGPSETTTYSTFAELDAATVDPVPIGGPVGGTSLAVVDAELRMVPPGGTGELLIGGAGVAAGYAGRLGATAGRFLPDPDRPGRRRYRTGDLVRWRPDGQLDFIGRADHQVKVRGFRVELGEVEAALRDSTPLREAAVLALGQGQARRLAAYLVPTRAVTGDPAGWLRGVRRRLGQKLPGYLVPGEFAVLAELPRSRHGKLDRERLAALPTVPLVAGGRVAPRTEPERRVAARWAEVLSVTEVGITDDFLDLGGHSLLLTRLAHLLGQEFAVEVSLAALWERRTVAGHAELLTAAAPAPSPVRAPVRRLDRSRFTAKELS